MIDFPNTPAIGDVYYAPSSGVSYRWDGTLWLAYPSAGPGYGPSGDFCAQYTAATATPTTLSLLTTMPVTSGNAGGWYVPATGRYTPPAGRYLISGTTCIMSTAGAVHHFIELRKNGATAVRGYDTIGALNWYTDPEVKGIFDCNGTDYFELWACSSGAGGQWVNIMFMAYPIAGAKGPTGDKGATGDVGTLASLHLHEISEVTSGTPAQLAVTIPLNAKKIEFDFYARCSTVVDANLCFQWMQGSTPLAANSYYGQYVYGSGTTPGTSPTGPATYWSIGGLMYWGGTMRAHLTADATGIPNWAETTIMGSATGGTRYAWHQMMYTGIPNAQITGIRMFYSAGQTFALGSFLKCFSIN